MTEIVLALLVGVAWGALAENIRIHINRRASRRRGGFDFLA